MVHRIEVSSKIPDARAEVRKRHLQISGFPVDNVEIVDIYTVDADIDNNEIVSVASMLSDPVTQQIAINEFQPSREFDWAIEVGFLPGVTDNIGNTARQGLEDLLRTRLPEEKGVASSQLIFLSGNLTKEQIFEIAYGLYNPLIQRIDFKSYFGYLINGGMDRIYPRVVLDENQGVDVVEILDLKKDELEIIGKKGIPNKDGTRRGPLALRYEYMKAIQSYFLDKERNPTDIELESLAQTWSEHCKHTIFRDQIDGIGKGIFKRFIKGATEKIRRKKGDEDFCVSVFTDNSGVIVFDEDNFITHKVETHNSPSALDPFGGSITGIVGVNRDAIGTGMGAKPVVNTYGFCFADPRIKKEIYKRENFEQKMLSSRRILEGIVQGVNVGGNCSGIPTPQGFMIFDESYRGKPLVFVGTVGIIPREINEKPSYEKKAKSGDYIVMVGGRVGKDGIHGATFSSEEMNSGSPATAVQIGDPITQKKLSDALVKEARDLELYHSITDNGAGGLSCSVAEMAKESGGFEVNLDQVPLKYPRLAPWEIWVSESQERMTLAVPKRKWKQFSELMKRRGVEATIIGEFTRSGRCIVNYDNKKIMDLDMDFLHDGLPKKNMQTVYSISSYEEPEIPRLEDLTENVHLMLGRLNIAGNEFISRQYDHEVQGGSVIKPLQGKGRVNGNTTVTRPILSSHKGIVLSQALNPTYGEISYYHMAACSIDTAIRNAVVVGADINHIALLDNFCWCSSDEQERLGQLLETAKGCYDFAVAFGTPFISGKDSMFNDFKGYDENGKPVKISVLPTLLISSIGVIDDSRKAVSLDAKFEGDLIYVLGETHDELGASEYFAMMGEQLRGERFIGNNVPKVDAEKNKRLYQAYSRCLEEEIVSSAQSVGVGGLTVALSKTSMGGKLGIDVSLKNLPGTYSRDDFALFSESQGRIVVTIAPQYKKRFEELMSGNSFVQVGTVKENGFKINGMNENLIVDTDVDTMLKYYKSTFGEY